ncbi:MAG: DUF4085 family protein [Gammaproteobacteria bacterium]|nr:MAG: DUF4085 family protein [Gammaproteobacteria bacterium]
MSGGQTNHQKLKNVFEEYRSYLASIKDVLPEKIVEFEAEYSLHDSKIKKIFCSFKNKEVILEFLGWNLNLEHQIYYTLIFSGVTKFKQTLPQQEYVESELGDLGYWEIESINSEIEVRMLFASGAEFNITFKEFSFITKNIKA